MDHANQRSENFWQILDQRQTPTGNFGNCYILLSDVSFALRKSPGLLCCVQKPQTTPAKQ